MSEGHSHNHAPTDFGRAFALGTLLNVGFVIAEVLYGISAKSMALIADAGHNLSDVLGLLIAWGAAVLSRRSPTERYTYGFRSSSILAALLNALFLLVAITVIAVEAIHRFSQPAPVAGTTVMIVAGIGIVINGATAMLFMSGRKGDLNIRGAFLHMAADAAVSAGVVVAGLAIYKTGLAWIDPVVSLIIVLVIAVSTWGLMKDSIKLSLHGVPEAIDTDAVRTFLLGQEKVEGLHDLHIWPMSTTETALTVHLFIPSGYPGDEFARGLADDLRHKFSIEHTTIQIETSEHTDCSLKPEQKV